MAFTLVTNLPVENNSSLFYRVKIHSSGNCISLIIFDNSTAYKGEITSEYICNQSKLFNQSENQYIEECRKAFKNVQSKEFTYIIVDDQFNLKKSIQSSASNSIKVKFCSIKLETVDFKNSIFDVLDATLKENEQYVQKVDELQSRNEALLKGNELLLEQLKELQNTKNNMESVLYLRFLNLLNSKKQKLIKLKRSLGEAMDEDESSEIEEEIELGSGTSGHVYDIDTDVDEEVGMAEDEFKSLEIPTKSQEVEMAKSSMYYT